jgi:hypothetical protein
LIPACWCSTNERDGLGDDLVPDFITRVRDRAFYGWPWYYLGANEDPRHRGERPDLKDKITLPDVLIQAHSASMGMVIYDGDQFPSEYRGDAFAAQHGSWNREKRTGYKVVRALLQDGVPTGEYEDFMTGFVVNDSSVWGRPVNRARASGARRIGRFSPHSSGYCGNQAINRDKGVPSPLHCAATCACEIAHNHFGFPARLEIAAAIGIADHRSRVGDIPLRLRSGRIERYAERLVEA